MTKWKAKASTAVFVKPLAEYFLRNHQRFLEHVGTVHGSTFRSDELVFVSGTLMTGDWVMARASSGSEEFDIGFKCSVTGTDGGHVHLNHSSTFTSVLPKREGPDRPLNFDYSITPEFDQCIFLKRLRIFERSFLSWIKQTLLVTTTDFPKDDLQPLHAKKEVVGDNDQSILSPVGGPWPFKIPPEEC